MHPKDTGLSQPLLKGVSFLTRSLWTISISGIFAPFIVKILEDYNAFGDKNQRSHFLEQIELVLTNPLYTSSIAFLLGAALVGQLLLLAIDRDKFRSSQMKNPANNEDDLQSILELVDVGALPQFKELGSDLFNRIDVPRSHEHEAFVAIAYQLARKEGNPKTIVVTSTKPSEGKTTCSLGIAQSLAALGFRTTLIDADFRKRSLSRNVRLSCGRALNCPDPYPDLSDLSAEQAADIVTHSMSIRPNLNFVHAKAENGNSAVRLMNIIRKRTIDHIQSEQDFIVIDSPPLLGLADANMLTDIATDIVFVIRANRLPLFKIANRIKALQNPNARLHCLLNGVEGRKPRLIERFSRWRFGPSADPYAPADAFSLLTYYDYGYGYGYGYNYSVDDQEPSGDQKAEEWPTSGAATERD